MVAIDRSREVTARKLLMSSLLTAVSIAFMHYYYLRDGTTTEKASLRSSYHNRLLTSDHNSNWKSVWKNRGVEAASASLAGADTLSSLIKADGFESGLGSHDPASWKQFTSSVYDKLNLSPGSELLEVGCGSSAFLYPFYEKNIRVTGVDYTKELLDIAKRAMTSGTFLQGEADSIPLPDQSFDSVLSHSVFHYFKSHDYAELSIKEMLRVLKTSKACLAILDVNDASKEADYLKGRAAGLGKEEYEKKYRDYPHLFYHKSWFRDLLQQEGLRVEIEDQDIAGYGNSRFRYNVFACR